MTGQWTVVKLVLGQIFGGYSLGSIHDITDVGPVLAAGRRLAHLPQPCTESLETDAVTYADKTQLLWSLLAAQADREASRGGVTEDGGEAVEQG